MKTNFCLLLATYVLSLYLTSCKVIYPPLRYETNLQHKIDPPKEENQLEWLGGDLAIANQIRKTPTITTYFAPPHEPFALSVIADYMVHELDGLERLFVNPAPVSPNDNLYISKLTLTKNNSLLVEITDFGNDPDPKEIFKHALPQLMTPSMPGVTDHYEFIGYWKDGKNRTLAQGIWVDVTAKEKTQGTEQLAASTFKNKTTLTYLGFPFTANIAPFPQLSNFGFMGGLQPSLLLGRKSKSSGFGSTTTDKGKEGFKSVDIGLLIGAGYRLENGLGFRLAYEHGLADITENEFESFKNRAIKLTATYDIPIHLISKK
jgi:hypothetical protein